MSLPWLRCFADAAAVGRQIAPGRSGRDLSPLFSRCEAEGPVLTAEAVADSARNLLLGEPHTRAQCGGLLGGEVKLLTSGPVPSGACRFSCGTVLGAEQRRNLIAS